MSAAPSTSLTRRVLLAVVGLVIAVAAGGLAFFKPEWREGTLHFTARVPLEELVSALTSLPMWVVGATLLITGASVPLRALQIRITARAVDGPPRLVPLMRASAVSVLGQNLLPAKLGDAARYLVLRQDARVPLPVSIAASVVDRAYDVTAMLLWACLVPVAFDLPAARVPGIRAFLPQLAGVATLMVVVMIIVVRAHAPIAGMLRGRFPRLSTLIDHFGESGIYATQPRQLLRGLPLACGLILLYALCVRVTMAGLGITVPFGSAPIVVTVIFLSTAIPGAPSGVGVFHAAALFVLHLLGVADKPALAFAVYIHAADVVGTTLAGGLILALTRGAPIRWRDLVKPLDGGPETPATP